MATIWVTGMLKPLCLVYLFRENNLPYFFFLLTLSSFLLLGVLKCNVLTSETLFCFGYAHMRIHMHTALQLTFAAR